jgi:hypothetical protein
MTIKHLFRNLAVSSLFFLASGSVYAQEVEETSTFSYPPLILLLVALIALRKWLIAEATPEHHTEHADHDHSPSVAKTPIKPAQAAAIKPAASATEKLIDLSKNATQCQGSTAKGSRCSRSSNLEVIETKVRGKNYRFMTCKQHNNKAFAPFSELIS